MQNISAVYSFKREKFSKFKISFKMSLFTLPGAILGAIAATKIEGVVFEKILGVVMIGVIITMLIPRKQKFYEEKIEKVPWLVYLAMFGVGFYGGFIQVGVGFILMAVLHYLLKENLVLVNVHKVFVVFIYTIPAIIIFAVTDSIDWFYGLSLAAGNATGAWWSAKLSVKKGEKIIKWVLLIAIFIMSLKLLGLF
ncbi:MAG: sulfite exporter TauE/SafE family protein [Melioribacteraceae bacterium]|nr:sulfite exporter TauE/SafE family protein [Melioribacteraceae bacterium]